MNHNLMRRAQSALATGLLLGGIIAATAQTLPPEVRLYRLGSNYVGGTVAPFNSGGGIPAQSYIYTPVYTNNTCVLSWYGTYGFYTVWGATSALGPWTAVTNVVSTNFACKAVLNTTNSSNSFFQLSQANSYAGSDQCASCHGNKYGGYKTTMHSGVYSNPGAVANFAPQCLTVGYGQPTGFVDPSTNANLENVGCENCHGPAGWHKNSDHDVILPVVSLDPAICGTCHQGPLHPTYQEYTNVISNASSNWPIGVITGGVGHSAGSHSGGCSVCHAANNRMAMVNEYYDMKAGNPHPLTFFATSSDQTVLGAASCATCHDPHSSNYVAQLRYPTFSTNYYAQLNLLDTRSVLVTNWIADGTMTNVYLTTNTITKNTVFDAIYNPNVQVCGQCHGGGRGMRWDGSTYGLVTNQVTSGPVTNTYYVDITTNVTVTQVFTNTIPFVTNNYTYTYVVGRYATNVVTLSQTNPVVGVGVFYPLIAYTNGTVQTTTNSSGDSKPHYPVQYNVLIGQLDYDLAARGGPPNVLTDPHTLAPNQCADCHVPSYVVSGSTNVVTGHTFVSDNNGCLAQCHSSSVTTAGLALKTLNSKNTCSNSMDRVVSLLRQWSTNVAPAILATNYGPLAWEYPSINSYFSTKSTNIVGGVSKVFGSGPPSAYKATLGTYPTGTNDNLQLNYVPQDIRMIRFALNVIYEDQSYGIHNPTYVKSVLAWAENDIITNQFIAAGYPTFSANVTTVTAGSFVQFSNTGSGTVYSWTFGDGGADSVANPSHQYNTPGLYSVTCTVDGKSLARTKYILVQ